MNKEVEEMVDSWKQKAETPMDNMLIGLFESMASNLSEEQQDRIMYNKRQQDVIDAMQGSLNIRSDN